MRKPRKKLEDTPAAACDAAAALLSRREHGARELGMKLRRKGFSEAVVDAALDELKRRDWLNEGRYAASVVRHRCAQGRGPRWVLAELSAQGIAETLCAEAMAQEELDWDAACARALQRLPGKDAAAKLKQKLYQRGFDFDQIDAALRRLEKGPAI